MSNATVFQESYKEGYSKGRKDSGHNATTCSVVPRSDKVDNYLRNNKASSSDDARRLGYSAGYADGKNGRGTFF